MPAAGISRLGDTLARTHMWRHVQLISTSGSAVPLTRQRQSHGGEGGGGNITASLPARLTHGAVVLARPVSMATDVKAARGNGCSGALPFLAMVTVTGAEYIVISAPSQQQPHSEVFHLSVFIVRATWASHKRRDH